MLGNANRKSAMKEKVREILYTGNGENSSKISDNPYNEIKVRSLHQNNVK